MKEKFYLTTAIAYTSQKPHIGNVYEAILADAIARFKRMQGYDVFFLTGTDEHGEKIESEAKKNGVTPQEYVDGVAGQIRAIWDDFHVSYDKFIRTTDEEHVRMVQKVFQKFYDQGDIYKGFYEGNYCTPCESFWTDSQLVDGCCPDCGRPVTKKREEAYYFRMSKYVDRLIRHIEEHEDFITPASRRNEMLNNFLRPGLQDLCVSRSTFRWGIPVPFDEQHVVYVWVDALHNYISAIGYDPDGPSEQFQKLWPADLQIIGKDIVRFHTIYWPIFLMALGLPLPKKVLGHPWLLFDQDKMSKSKGNVLYGDELIAEFGLDAVRYYLLAEMGFYQDGNISYELLIQRTNADLANTLGNLVSRTVAMVKQYFGGVVPSYGGADSPAAETLKRSVSEKLTNAYRLLEEYSASDSLAQVFLALKSCNKYIDETAPWTLAKDESRRQELADVLANLVESIRLCNVMLSPFLPDAASRIDGILTAEKPEICDGTFAYAYPCAGHTLGDAPILFARIDEKKFLAELAKKKAGKKPEKKPEKPVAEVAPGVIGIEDFGKVALTVGEVLSCEPVEGSEKLLKLQVSLGAETRQIVSGISPWYRPEDLTGKHIVVVSNLKPAKLRGVESQGMLLAADTPDGVKVLFADGVPAGSRVH